MGGGSYGGESFWGREVQAKIYERLVEIFKVRGELARGEI